MSFRARLITNLRLKNKISLPGICDNQTVILPVWQVEHHGKKQYALWTVGHMSENREPLVTPLGCMKIDMLGDFEGISTVYIKEVLRGATPMIQKLRDTFNEAPDNAAICFLAEDEKCMDAEFFQALGIPITNPGKTHLLVANKDSVPIKGVVLAYGGGI